MVDSCNTQYYANGVSKLFYGSSRSSLIYYSKTIVSNSVDTSGTRTISYIDCWRGSTECQPVDTLVISSGGDLYLNSTIGNARDFLLNLCWPIGTSFQSGPILTKYEYNSIVYLFGEPYNVKVYRQFLVDTTYGDTSELHSIMLSDTLGIIGDYEPNQREYTSLLLGAVINGVPFGVTTSVVEDEREEVSRSLRIVVKDVLPLPDWVMSFAGGSIVLYDSQGRVLLSQAIADPSLDVSGLAPGAYFIVASDANLHRSGVITIIIIY